MRTLLRIYVYGVSFVTLLAASFGGLKLIASLTPTWFGDNTERSAGRCAAVAAVALVIWAVHTFLSERAARPLTMAGAAERGSATRKAYLYLGQFVVVTTATVMGIILANNTLWQISGGLSEGALWPQRATSGGASIAFLMLSWGYLRWTVKRDGDFGAEVGLARSIRHAYYYAIGLGGSTLITLGASQALRVLLSVGGYLIIAGGPLGTEWRTPFITAISALIAGLPLGGFAWRAANRVAMRNPHQELNSLSRKLVLQLGVVAGTAMSLISLGTLLRRLLGVLFGGMPENFADFWNASLVSPIAYLPVGLALWLVFARALEDDREFGGQTPSSAHLQRGVRYGLAAIALGLTAYGASGLLQMIVLVSLGLQPPVSSFGVWIQVQLSLYAAMTLVSAPAWWGHWWPQQLAARKGGPAGRAEIASPERSAYLYGILLACSGVVLYNLGFTIYSIIRANRSASVTPDAFATLVGSGAFAAVALILWIVHAMIMRADSRWAQQDDGGSVEIAAVKPESDEVEALPVAPPVLSNEPAPAPASVRQFDRASLPEIIDRSDAPVRIAPEPSIVVIDGEDGTIGAALARALRAALPQLTIVPLGLNEQAGNAMRAALGQEIAASAGMDSLDQADIIAGPSDIVTAGGLGGEISSDLAGAILGCPALKLLLPPRSKLIRWVGVPEWPLEKWVENAVREIKDALA